MEDNIFFQALIWTLIDVFYILVLLLPFIVLRLFFEAFIKFIPVLYASGEYPWLEPLDSAISRLRKRRVKEKVEKVTGLTSQQYDTLMDILLKYPYLSILVTKQSWARRVFGTPGIKVFFYPSVDLNVDEKIINKLIDDDFELDYNIIPAASRCMIPNDVIDLKDEKHNCNISW